MRITILIALTRHKDARNGKRRETLAQQRLVFQAMEPDCIHISLVCREAEHQGNCNKSERLAD